MVMHGPEKPREASLRFWNNHHVYVIGHQTVGQDPDASFVPVLSDQFEIRQIVKCLEKRSLLANAALCDMVRYAWDDDSGKARHFGDSATLTTDPDARSSVKADR